MLRREQFRSVSHSSARCDYRCYGVPAAGARAPPSTPRSHPSPSRLQANVAYCSTQTRFDSPQGVRRYLHSSTLLRAGSSKIPNSKAANETWKGLPEGWQAVIGVECHAQIKARTKLFSCGCRAERSTLTEARLTLTCRCVATPLPTLASEPNTLVSPFDAAHPGTLPQLELGALAAAIRASLFLHCQVQPYSRFDRKHYFYLDLPPGYQITQRYGGCANIALISVSGR